MILPLMGLLLGLALLLGGGASLVKGASGIAAQFGVSAMMVGLTVVAFGTSAPELVVNVVGALNNQTELAFGNVIGSNLANLGLVLGVAAFLRPMVIDGKIVLREIPLLLLATGVMTIMAADPVLRGTAASIDRSDALILILIFCVFLYVAALDVIRRRSTDPLLASIEDITLATGTTLSSTNWLFLAIGVMGLFVGGQLTVRNGVQLAEILNIPSAIIGLFVVAIGTSLPELVTSSIAALRGESDLALGNLVGSNLFNGLMVLPISALIRPVTIPAGGMFDLGVSLLFALALIPIFWVGRARLGKKVGLTLVLSYLAYAVWRIL